MKKAEPKKTGTEFFDKVVISLVNGMGHQTNIDIDRVINHAEKITKARGKFVREKLKEKKEKQPPAPPEPDGSVELD